MLLGLGGAALGAAGVYAATSLPEAPIRATLTPTEMRDALVKGQIMVVDIRRPDEWASTGIAQGAIPIDMRREDFLDALLAARPTETMPIAIICARGVRSRRLSNVLIRAGVSPIIDIPEGMIGSRAGPGYIKAGLPVTPWTG